MGTVKSILKRLEVKHVGYVVFIIFFVVLLFSGYTLKLSKVDLGLIEFELEPPAQQKDTPTPHFVTLVPFDLPIETNQPEDTSTPEPSPVVILPTPMPFPTPIPIPTDTPVPTHTSSLPENITATDGAPMVPIPALDHL